jgi:putative peptide zinc metalloprotease protein
VNSVLLPSSHLQLRALEMRAEGDEWIVGSRDAGSFVALPLVAVSAIELLQSGLTVDDVHRQLLIDQSTDVDILSFANELISLDFVTQIDDYVLPDISAKVTFPWLLSQHVRWVTTQFMAMGFLFVVAAAVVTILRTPSIVPRYSDLLWSSYGGLVLAVNVFIAWILVLVHECAHLTTARAYDVRGRISLGTRLQFLVAQTDVSGLWAVPQRQRLVVYLSGIVVDLGIAAIALLLRAFMVEQEVVYHLLGVIVILQITALPFEFLVFMRTDIYFVLQDMMHCRNLYADGSAYLQYRWRRLTGVHNLLDPSASLSFGERRAVRAYVVLLALGTLGCLTFAFLITAPFTVALIDHALLQLSAGPSLVIRADAVLTLIVSLGVWIVWLGVWWRRHGTHARRWLLTAGNTGSHF